MVHIRVNLTVPYISPKHEASARRCPARARRAVALGLVLLASCSRCGAPKALDAAELLPAQASSAAVTAPLGALAAKLAATSLLAAQIPGGEALGTQLQGVSQSLGFDVTSRDALVKAGLDPERGAALALLPAQPGEQGQQAQPQTAGAQRQSWILALPLSSESAFAQAVEATLSGRAGFPLRSDEPRSGVHAVVFARASQAEKLGYAIVRGYGVIARGVDPAALLAEASARPLEKSLAQEPRLARARVELEKPDLIYLSSSGNPFIARLAGRAPPGESALGLALQPDGLALRVTQDLPPAAAQELRGAFAPVAPEAFQAPLAPLALTLAANPGALPGLLGHFAMLRDPFNNLRNAMSQAGADLEKDLLAPLSPGVAISIDLAPAANIGRALDPQAMDLRAHTPFDVLRLYAATAARDPEAAKKGLDALAKALPGIGAQAARSAEKKAIAGGLVDEWTTRYPGGEGVRFGVFVPGRDLCGQSAPARTQALVYALGGAGSLEEVLAAHLPCGRSNNAGAANVATAKEAPLRFDLDLGLLAGEIGKLPDASYGAGPQVFVARSVVSQVVVPLQRLRASGELSPNERGFSLALKLAVLPSPGQAPPP